MKSVLIGVAITILIVAAVLWGGFHIAQLAATADRSEVPVTTVKKGRVNIVVAARGELQGGNSEMLTAPMAGGTDLIITDLRDPGEYVEAGDIVAEFDTTQQEFNLREAEADLAEAEQQVKKAQADADAALEEARYQALSAAADVKQAELEIRKNEVLAGVVARQNEIALEAARNRQKQAQQDLENKKKTSAAGVAIQQTGVQRARISAQLAQRTIEGMVLKAKTAGYINVQPNSNQNIFFSGQLLPPFQTGDSARAGQAVAQIPDMSSWEVSARILETDRAHIQPGLKVSVGVAAIPGREFKAHVKSVGTASGPAWERVFESRIGLDEIAPEMRPGMTSNILVTVESLEDVLWIPAQALMESDGRSFVYARSPEGAFTPQDVQLVRRSESQAVITGIDAGREIAMSKPEQQKSAKPAGVMKALQK
jgi:HlyD family secretion protein